MPLPGAARCPASRMANWEKKFPSVESSSPSMRSISSPGVLLLWNPGSSRNRWRVRSARNWLVAARATFWATHISATVTTWVARATARNSPAMLTNVSSGPGAGGVNERPQNERAGSSTAGQAGEEQPGQQRHYPGGPAA